MFVFTENVYVNKQILPQKPVVVVVVLLLLLFLLSTDLGGCKLKEGIELPGSMNDGRSFHTLLF